MKIINNLKNRVDFKFIATFFLTLIAVTISSAAILFIVSSHINGFLFIIDYLLTIGLMNVFYKKKLGTKKILDNIIIASILFFILCTISTIFYDFSYDGNDYHKQLIGLLKNGVNPIYNYQSGSIWTNHYANGSEVWSAVLYAFTDNIETGKVINLLLAFALCFISFDYIYKKSDRPILSALFSLALAFNPIVLAQFHTYYIDGIVDLSLITLILALVIIIDGKQDFSDKANYLILASSIIICVNAKFTALLLAMLFAGLLGGFTFIYNLVKKNSKFAWKYFALMACIFAFAVGIVGSSSYVKNTLTHGNPFYPLKGEGAVDIETDNEPKSFSEFSNTKKFLYGTFSKSYTWYDQEPQLKIPFTIYRSEFESIQFPDVRIGGLGMWFSGMFIISMVVILVSLLIMIKNKIKEAWIVGILLVGILLPIPILPIVWQARYYPEIYLLPFIALTILLSYKSSKFSLSKCVAYGLLFITVVNTLFFVPQVHQTLRASNIANDSLTYLAEQSLTKKVIISPAGDVFNGVYYNYIDKGIKFEYQAEPLENGNLLYRGMLYKIVEENE